MKKGVYLDLTNKYPQAFDKEQAFFAEKKAGGYVVQQENFAKIPGAPVAYWVSEAMLKAFSDGTRLGEIAQPKKGLDTADNERFVRNWCEVDLVKIGFNCSKDKVTHADKKWFPLNSGGAYRKWYGNFEKIINWANNGKEIKEYPKAYVRGEKFYFEEGLSWTKISSSKLGVRFAPQGLIFDSAGQSVFSYDEKYTLTYLLAMLCSNIAFDILKILNPTLNYQVGDIGNVPIIMDDVYKSDVENLTQKNIHLSKVHPFVKTNF